MNTLESVAKLQNIIDYKFKDNSLISIAVFHPGLKKHDTDFTRNFERLEFLGDRVLGLSLSNFLYKNFYTDSEGELAVRMASLAGTEFLINLAKKSKIIDCFFIPKDFFISKNKNSSSIADMLEAVFGAIFLDSDFNTVARIIVNLWGEDIDKVSYKKKDSKTQLQEIVQAECSELPVYRLIKMTGEAHDPLFQMEVTACGLFSIGYGNSKKSAEHNAAKKMIDQLNEVKVKN